MKQKIVIIAIVAVAGLFILNKTLQAVGLKDSPAEKNEQNNLSNKWLTGNPFVDYVKKEKFKIPSQIENFVIPSLLNKIHDAKGFFNDDEEAVYTFFRELQSKMQCSAVAYYFRKEYNTTLTAYLSTFLNAEEINKIVEIVNKKPKNVSGFYTAGK